MKSRLVAKQDSVQNLLMLHFSPKPNQAYRIPWHEWNDDAFRLAQEQNKPVMLFLGAFWCGYCQRMDEEAFSETENIALLNAYFISIRVENAQRPDIDSRYNQNGWPTIVFMTPKGNIIVATNFLPGDQFQDLLLRVYMGHQEGRWSDPVPSAPTSSPSPPLSTPSLQNRLEEITGAVWKELDTVNGGCGHGQKFIHAEVNDFLLARFTATNDRRYLDQVCLTLDRMREGEIHDRRDGGYFRTTSNPDWSRPHREKLLAEQAGLARNCMTVFKLTQNPVYADMATEILGYLVNKLYDPKAGIFWGCEDFIRTFPDGSAEAFSTVIDSCIYSDANALAAAVLLDAAAVLKDRRLEEIALGGLKFLLRHCCDADGKMYHCFDGKPRCPGLLTDQTQMALALLAAYESTGDRGWLGRAKVLVTHVLSNHKNTAGGFYDRSESGAALLRVPLTLIEQNGPAASLFLRMARITGENVYREASLWALSAFADGLSEYGIYGAGLGIALSERCADPVERAV